MNGNFNKVIESLSSLSADELDDLIDEKLNELEDEIGNDPFYFIERFGYDMSGEITFKKNDPKREVMFYE